MIFDIKFVALRNGYDISRYILEIVGLGDESDLIRPLENR